MMKLNKIAILFILAQLVTFNVYSQLGNLRISIYHNNYEVTPCFELTIYHLGETAFSQYISNENEIFIDSLSAGNYNINLNNCGPLSDNLIQSISKNVDVKPYQITDVYIDLSEYENHSPIDTITFEEKIRWRNEVQFEISYFDYRWNPSGNDPKFNLCLGCSLYKWHSFSKHFGFLVGGGVNYMFAPLRIKSGLDTIYQKAVKSNYYSYWSGQIDFKFRISSLNQQSSTIKGHSVFIDIGVLYNLPLYFKKITRFNIHDKMVNSFIHKYTDARVYANIGFKNVQFWGSYRPFDFVRGDFQELPRYNAGIKLNIPY